MSHKINCDCEKFADYTPPNQNGSLCQSIEKGSIFPNAPCKGTKQSYNCPYLESYKPIHHRHFPADLEQQFVEGKAEKFIKWVFEDYVEDVVDKTIGVNPESIAEIIDMVERRRVYLHIYHRINMSQYNEASLYCYWILKLQPFFPMGGNKEPVHKININFAKRLFYRTIQKTRQVKNRGIIKDLNLVSIENSFQVHDLSKESIMLLMENLVNLQ